MNRLLKAVFTLLLCLFVSTPSDAQTAIGGQIGDPTGISIKAGQGRGAVMLAVGWDLSDSITAEAHYLLQDRRPRGSASDVRFFYGPGVFVNARDNRKTIAGISLGVGLGIMIAPEIEVYGILSPRLQLINRTDFDVGGGIGARLTL